MAKLNSIIEYCDSRTNKKDILDFDNAFNGLQLENNGIVNKIGASVDIGQIPFELAIENKVDLIICHHGLFWDNLIPITNHIYKKLKTAIDNNIAVYSSHLPLDCHPEIGNNVILAKKIGLEPIESFLDFKNTKIGLICKSTNFDIKDLTIRLKKVFPKTFNFINYGKKNPKKIAILTGSGQSAISHLKDYDVDTLITGELRQHHFNIAQELKLNLFHCGHYSTETFGVTELSKEVSEKFNIEWTFLHQDCLI